MTSQCAPRAGPSSKRGSLTLKTDLGSAIFFLVRKSYVWTYTAPKVLVSSSSVSNLYSFTCSSVWKSRPVFSNSWLWWGKTWKPCFSSVKSSIRLRISLTRMPDFVSNSRLSNRSASGSKPCSKLLVSLEILKWKRVVACVFSHGVVCGYPLFYGRDQDSPGVGLSKA